MAEDLFYLPPVQLSKYTATTGLLHSSASAVLALWLHHKPQSPGNWSLASQLVTSWMLPVRATAVQLSGTCMQRWAID
ncbi:unnamed protein product [Gadus morhua 'NCC']